METNFLSANESLKKSNGSEVIYKFGMTAISYTEGVQEIAKNTQSYWLLDIICSYQNKLKKEEFQVWKLERYCTTEIVNNIKKVLKRKDSFIVVCEDGNNNILLTQKIPFSDFPFDEYIVWLQNEIIYLPSEH